MTTPTATRKTVCWPRKVFHASTITVTALVVWLAGLDRSIMLLVAGILSVLFVGLDTLRLARPTLNKLAVRSFAGIMRKHEQHSFSSGTWFMPAVFLALLVAPKPAVVLSLLYLAFGDPVASWVGVRFGRIRLPGGKTLEGSLAFVLTCMLIGVVFLGATGTTNWVAAPVVALGGALAAGVAEWLPVKHVDDNMRVPLAAAPALAALIALFAQSVST